MIASIRELDQSVTAVHYTTRVDGDAPVTSAVLAGTGNDIGSHPERGLRWSRRYGMAALLGCLWLSRDARADGLADDALWRYRTGDVALDAGVVAAAPAALPTGLAKGLGAGITLGRGLTWGARARWATATESAAGWTVTHHDLAVRATTGASRAIGRGVIGLSLGLGATLVREARHRVRGDIAGATGTALETTATAIGPAGDLEAVVGLHLTGSWMLRLAGGPSLVRIDGEVRSGWTTYVGIGWQL